MLTYIKINRHPSSFTVTRLHTLFPAYKLDRPLIVEGWRGCAHRSCIIAFDLIELNGDDLRRDPLEVRKATLASTLAKAGPGIRFNEHLECDDGEIVFRHACKVGLDSQAAQAPAVCFNSGSLAMCVPTPLPDPR